MFIDRLLGSTLKNSKASLLLLGPRQAGKSTLISSLKPELIINLMHEPTFLAFARNPSELEERLKASKPSTCFIDEIQRLPNLLNTLQTIIDSTKSIRFLLTGSSARKLKRGQANLLPGRIHVYNLGPLCAAELNYKINAQQALATGLLPGIYSEPSVSEREKTLRSYGAIYLKEEIQAEALTRNIEGFSRFIFVAAQYSGSLLDFAKLSSEAQIPRQSAIRYFEILEETMLVHRCLSFSKSSKKRLIQHPKYYFFDTGVLNGLLENFTVSADRKGALFEALVFNQLIATFQALDLPVRLSTYRTEHGSEVDFILEVKNDVWAIEVKASTNVGKNDLRGFSSFSQFTKKPFSPVVCYLGQIRKEIQAVSIYPWQDFLKHLVQKYGPD